MITNLQSGTNVHEIADGIYRINTPIAIPGGPDEFNFNQYLIVDDAPLLFHTGPRKLFPLVREAMGRVMPVERLRYVAFSHFEADECGVAERVARGGAACGNGVWADCRDGVGERRSGIDRHARSPTGSFSRSASMPCAGLTRRICRTAGTAD